MYSYDQSSAFSLLNFSSTLLFHFGKQILTSELYIIEDGKTATITSPSTQAQIDLIKACYRRAGLDMSETAYVEAHQTGTQGGDVVEAEALAKTFGNARSASWGRRISPSLFLFRLVN